MVSEADSEAEPATRAPQDVPSIVMISEPGGSSLLRALGLLSVSGLSLQSLELRHDGAGGEAVSRIWLREGRDDPRIGAVCLKISQLPTVTSAETPAETFAMEWKP